MKSQKYIGLGGLIIGVILLFVEVGFQHILSRGVLLLLVILTLYGSIFSGQYAFTADKKTSAIGAFKITLLVTIIGVVLGLLKLFLIK